MYFWVQSKPSSRVSEPTTIAIQKHHPDHINHNERAQNMTLLWVQWKRFNGINSGLCP